MRTLPKYLLSVPVSVPIPGVAAKMFGALASAGINTEMVTTSEIRITALINEEYTDLAMRAIHETFLE